MLRERFDTFKVIALIATRNLLASRLKTLIVGGIIFFGALLVVLGTSLLDSVDHGHEPQHHRQRGRPHPGLLGQVQGRAGGDGQLRLRRAPTWRRSTTSPGCATPC